MHRLPFPRLATADCLALSSAVSSLAQHCGAVHYALETTRVPAVCPFHPDVIIRISDDVAESHAFERANGRNPAAIERSGRWRRDGTLEAWPDFRRGGSSLARLRASAALE